MTSTVYNIATCTVTLHGYHNPNDNNNRMKILSDATYAVSTKDECDLFVLPGGYFSTTNISEVNSIQLQMEQLVKAVKIDLLVGIDVIGSYNQSIFFSKNGQVKKWSQRSINSGDQWKVTDTECFEERMLCLNPHVEGLICGEIFNSRIRDGLVTRNTTLVIDQAHLGNKFRVWSAMNLLAKRGVASLCSVHVNQRNAVKYCYVPVSSGSEKKSSREVYLIVGNNPRIEIKIWKFDLNGQNI